MRSGGGVDASPQAAEEACLKDITTRRKEGSIREKNWGEAQSNKGLKG